MSAAGTGITVLITAGGTGGHVYPALAVAQRLRAMGARVEWLGARGGLEESVVQGAGIPLHLVSVRGLRRTGVSRRAAAPFGLVAAVLGAARVLRRVRPDVVLGMGGYAAGPGGLAAWLLRIPLLVHEQNARAGLTNRVLARLARGVLEAFPGTFPGHAIHTGNPVRPTIAALPPPEERLAARSGPLRLLVLGGSQGAEVLNVVIPHALAALSDQDLVRVRHQTGRRNLEPTVRRYADAGLDIRPEAFIDDMAAAYAWSDLVVCRAGAMTVAELAAAGVAAVLVPYPHAADDHQTWNARFLADASAALLVPQAELDADRLGRILDEFAHARARLLAMARAARRLAIPDAAARVAELCTEAARA